MRSMTGYGRASLERDGRELTLELKTVNHRFLDLNIRLPRALLFLEDGMRKGLNTRLSRGHVDVFINYRNAREDAREVTLDSALLKAYARAMDEAAALLPDVRDDRSLARLVTMPDVLVVAEKAEDQDAVTALCADVLNLACDALEQMRAREGESIGRDLAAKVDNLERIAGEIAERAPGVVKDYQQRLNERIAELLQSPPDPQRIAQEVAEQLISLGVRGIWNFTNTELNVGSEVFTEDVHFADSLLTLSYRISETSAEAEEEGGSS